MRSYDVVEAWLDNVAYAHSGSDRTRDNYTRFLLRFCKFVGVSPEQILADCEQLSERRFKRMYAQHVRAFIGDLARRGSASQSISTIVTAVKSFFMYNDLPLGFIPVGSGKVTYHNRDITKEEIVEVLKISKPRERAFFSVMAQSGLRPATLSKLKLKHIEPEFTKGVNPCIIRVPEELSKGKFGAYFTFMSEESLNYLRAYLNTRRNVALNDWLFTCEGTNQQLNVKSMSGFFSRALDKLKANNVLDFDQVEPGKPRTVRLYCLRKYFRNRAALAGVEYVNFWMGHKTNYKAPHIPSSDVHYFSREDTGFQRDLYENKAVPNLRLETATPTEREAEIVALRKQVKELEERDLGLSEEEIQKLKTIAAMLKDGRLIITKGSHRIIN